jgi:hypothetical protein
MCRPRLLVLVLASAAVNAACDASVDIGRKLIQQPPPGGTGGQPGSDPGFDAAPDPDAAPDTGPDAGPPLADALPPADDPRISDAEPPGDALATILWSTSLENGDLSDWSQGGATVGGAYQQRVTAAVSNERAHTGTRAIRIAFDTADDQDHMAEFYRRVEPGPAYYSAWFLIPEARAPSTYWTLLYFFTEGQAGNSFSRRGLWDVNLDRQSVYFFNEAARRSVDPSPRVPYPIGQWFHLEAYFAYEPPRNGHITVWLDGQPVLDVPDLGVAPSDNLYWGVGSDTDGVRPSNCTMYLDDAAVSTARLGP